MGLTFERLCMTFCLTLLAAALAGPGAAQNSPTRLDALAADPGIEVEQFGARQPERSFVVTGEAFDGGLALRSTGEVRVISDATSSGLVALDGSRVPLTVEVVGDGTVAPGQTAMIRLTATLPASRSWKGEVWLTVQGAPESVPVRTAILIEVERAVFPPSALTLALDSEVRAEHCLSQAFGFCETPDLVLRGSVTNDHDAPLPVPGIRLLRLEIADTNLSRPVGVPETTFAEMCTGPGVMMQPGQFCTFTLSLDDLPEAGRYQLTFAAEAPHGPLQPSQDVTLHVRASWWLLMLIVSAGVGVAVFLNWWAQSGRVRVSHLPEIARLRDLVTGLAAKETDAEAKALAETVAARGRGLIAGLLNPSTAVTDLPQQVAGYAQKVEVLGRWLSVMQVIRALEEEAQQRLAPLVQAVAERLENATAAPDDTLLTAFAALLKSVDDARAETAVRATAKDRLAALRLVIQTVPADKTILRDKLTGHDKALVAALDGDNVAAITEASAAAARAMAGQTEAFAPGEGTEPTSDPGTADLLQVILSAGLPGPAASEADFRRAARWMTAGAALASLLLTILAATQLLWFSNLDWGTPENRMAAFAFGLAVGYGTQSVMQTLTASLPVPGRRDA